MERRTLLKTALFALPLLALGRPRRVPLARRFYVAGARFYAPPPEVAPGDVVELRPADFGGHPALAVFHRDRQIGWIPKSMVRHVPSTVRSATLDRVRLHEVPWRWYRITLA